MDLTDRLLGASRPPSGATAVATWAGSGAMALTGRSDGSPLVAPRSLVGVLGSLAGAVEASSGRLAAPVALDTPALLGERAALAGFGRQGTRSCGGATRLLPAADGWVAVSLARPDDVALVPAWLDGEPLDAGVARRPAAAVVERAALLGLPCAALGETAPTEPAVVAYPLGARPATRALAGVLVVNLASMWAGPLCANLLALAGARVVKVESTHRPDGARRGATAFFDLLHAGQQSVALDFTDPAGRRRLRALLEQADVVIEGSRPRALQQLGIDAGDPSAARVWVSITGYGRDGDAAGRVAFGDDAAVAGGLVAWDGDTPCFCADAVADPLTGLASAAAVLDRLEAGGGWLVDVALARVAARGACDDSLRDGWDGPVAPPRARPVTGTGPALGADTERVLAELGIA